MKKILFQSSGMLRLSFNPNSTSKLVRIVVIILIITFSCACDHIIYAQSCPCVKTSVIGNGFDSGIQHNNKVKAMNDTSIVAGKSITLRTLFSAGNSTWAIEGTEEVINDLTVTPYHSTSYVVKSVLDDCPVVYDTVYIEVHPFIKTDDIVILFPNPSPGNVTIKAADFFLSKIEVVNENGIIIYTAHPPDKSTSYVLNVNKLPKGVYIFKIYTLGNTLQTRKFIKE